MNASDGKTKKVSELLKRLTNKTGIADEISGLSIPDVPPVDWRLFWQELKEWIFVVCFDIFVSKITDSQHALEVEE